MRGGRQRPRCSCLLMSISGEKFVTTTATTPSVDWFVAPAQGSNLMRLS